jgi:hypothetical protein
MEHGKIESSGRIGAAAVGGVVSGMIMAADPGLLVGAAGNIAGGITRRLIASHGASAGSLHDVLMDGATGMIKAGARQILSGVFQAGMAKLVTGSNPLSKISADAARTAPALVHLSDAGDEIAESGSLIGPQGIYATSAKAAGKSGMALTMSTGLTPGRATSAFAIPEAAESAFTKPLPIGPITAWQRLSGTQYTAAGILDLGTGAFTRTGVNWNQAALYGVDATITGTTAIGVSVKIDH